uniref:Uncharacterized protein n=1 Tax=Poecilia reticulata TaxID=8081 RepID=A0A3P9Q5J6_POERE
DQYHTAGGCLAFLLTSSGWRSLLQSIIMIVCVWLLDERRPVYFLLWDRSIPTTIRNRIWVRLHLKTFAAFSQVSIKQLKTDLGAPGCNLEDHCTPNYLGLFVAFPFLHLLHLRNF